jgi:hypothetical protein
MLKSRLLALVCLVASATFMTARPMPAVATESVQCSKGSASYGGKIYYGVTICTITEPDVRVPIKEYPQVQYHTGDEISIAAGGCVQTGGVGKTWKLYTWPRGSSSGILYHGLVYLPGVWPWRGGVTTYPGTWTWDGNDVKRVADAMAQRYIVTNASGLGANWLHLWLGYEDDNYGDNGYWSHDDGNDDQCKNSQNAYVIVTIVPHPENPQPQYPDSTGTPQWANWKFPPPAKPVAPPNPFHVDLAPSYNTDAPNRTVYYRGTSLLANAGCANPTVTNVRNTSDFPIDLAYGDAPQNPLTALTIEPYQSTGAFKGDPADGSWQGWGLESGSFFGKYYTIGIDITWTCSPQSGNPLTSTVVTKPLALRTIDGHFVTIVNGGGLGGPNVGPGSVALHTDAVKAKAWETFHVVWIDATRFALKTIDGHFVTAVNGGGIGGPNDASSPVHTDATALGPWEKLTFVYDIRTQTASIQTPDGRYLTAVNGGGFGGPNNVPIHTDATQIGPWERFTVVPAR